MTHHAHREVDEMINQLGLQMRKSYKKQESPDELMKQLKSVSSVKKPRKSVKPSALKPRDYLSVEELR